MPEIYITCNDVRLFVNTITVKQYRKYAELMQKNQSNHLSDAMFFNLKIVQEIFGNRMSLEQMEQIDVVEMLMASKTIHFIMQNIISPKFLELQEPIQREESAFDEYDMENGYVEEIETESIWEICGENIDCLVRIAIKLLKNSYSQCMDTDIVCLLDFIKFELKKLNKES